MEAEGWWLLREACGLALALGGVLLLVWLNERLDEWWTLRRIRGPRGRSGKP